MDFGLGLVLSFTDNATAGINNAVNSLSQLTSIAENASTSLNQMASLSALSVVSDQLGNSFVNAGRGILGVFSNVLNQTKIIGSEFENFDVTLTSLFGGASEGAKKSQEALSRLFDFAKKSPLEVGDVKDMIVTLQSQGINAFDQATGAISGTRQEFLAFLTDLKSFKPEVPNERFKMAIQNYIGSGEKKMMRTVFDMGDIEDIIGHAVSDTAEGRMQDIIEMVENKGLTGLSEEMSETWSGVASNISDAFTQIYYSIANNGVFEKLKSSFVGMADSIIKLNPERLQTIGKTIAEGLNIIVEPIVWVSDKISKLINVIINLCETNPSLVKLGITLSAIVGAFLVATGVVLKATSAFSGISLMWLAFGNSFKSIGSLFRTGALKMLSVLLPLTATIGLIALAWKSDFAGIRTNLTYFVNGIATSFRTARQAVDGSVSDLISKLNELRNKDDFFSNLTIGLMEVMMLFKALADGWNDYTLSEDNFLKAKELGILPLIEAILDLKYRFGFFKQGFIDGWREIGENVKTAVKGFLDNIEGTPLETLVDNLTSFLQKLASGDTQAWYDFGKSFAEFTAKAIAFWAVFKVVGKVFGILSKVVTFFVGIKNTISGIISFIKGLGIVDFILKIVEVIRLVVGGAGTLHEALVAVFGTVGTITAGIASVISGVVLAVINFFDMLKGGFSWLKEILMVVGIALTAIGAIILGAPALVAGIIAGIVALVATLIVVIKDNWGKICSFFSTIGSWIYDNVIKPVADFFVGLWNGIVMGVTTAFNAVKNFLSTIANWIYTNIIQPVVNFFTTIIFPIISKIVEIVMKIVEIITVLVGVFVQWIKANVIDPIVNFFVGLWNTIVAGITSFVESAKAVIGTIVEWINTNIITPVATFFTNLWTGIVSGVTSFIESVKTVFSTIVTWIKTNIIDPISTFFSGLWEGIKTAFNVVADTITGVLKGAVNTVLSFICGVINGVINGINWAIDVINAIPGVSITKIETLEVPQLAQGGVVDKPTLSVVGEAGTEAVMPLENNTGWIGRLASMITTQMGSIRPTNNNQMTTTNQGDTNQRYLTNNNSTNNTYEGDTDNSIVFNEGAIQITVQNASEEEAIRMARMVMEYIKRQKELDRMTKYA